MADPNRGIFHKYDVRRLDGTDAKGEKHYGCGLFVLDTVHDPFATPALIAYAEACRDKMPKLAADIERMLAGVTMTDIFAEDAATRTEVK